MIVYGIKNCDTVKKALKWLDDNNLEYEFHDFKKMGISVDKLQLWANDLGWEPLVNKKGTTWRKLTPECQALIINASSAFKLMQESTSVIKRPVIEGNGHLLIGFDEAAYTKLLVTKQ